MILSEAEEPALNDLSESNVNLWVFVPRILMRNEKNKYAIMMLRNLLREGSFNQGISYNMNAQSLTASCTNYTAREIEVPPITGVSNFREIRLKHR